MEKHDTANLPLGASQDIYNKSDIDASLEEMKKDIRIDMDGADIEKISIDATLPQKSPLQIMEAISQQMGEYFNSLKAVEKEAAKVADQWFENAALLASTDEKLTEEKETQILINISLGVATLGLTNIFTTVKMKVELEKVKKELRNQANTKLDDLVMSFGMQEETCNLAYSRFLEAKGYEEVIRCFENYRQNRYYLDCSRFLIATYKAALRNEFQSEISYPSYYQIDSQVFYQELTKTRMASSEEAIIQAKSESIISVAKKTAEVIVGNGEPTHAEVLLATDEAVTAMAILDVTPDISTEETDQIDESEVLSFIKTDTPLFKLILIREVADDKNSPFSEAVRGNRALNCLYQHIMNLGQTNKRYQSLCNLHGINTLLFAVLFFCLSFFSWDFAWYWSILIGIVGYFIGSWMAPWKSLREKFLDKVAMITNCIKYQAKQMAGKADTKLLSEINVSTKKRIYLIILGGIIGLIGGPVGLIIGLIFGASMAGVFDGKEREMNVEDYENFSIGSKVKPIVIMIVLTGLIGLVIWNNYL